MGKEGRGGSTMVSTRPNWGPSQVRFVKDLKKGGKFQTMHGNDKKWEFVILSNPKKGWMKIEITSGVLKGIEKEISLVDHCIRPQKDPKMWNSVNWIARI